METFLKVFNRVCLAITLWLAVIVIAEDDKDVKVKILKMIKTVLSQTLTMINQERIKSIPRENSLSLSLRTRKATLSQHLLKKI